MEKFEKSALSLEYRSAYRFTADEYCILAYLLDIAPGDDKILLAPEKAEKFRPAIDDKRDYPAVADIYLDIADKPKPTAVIDIDDVLSRKILNAAHIKPHISADTIFVELIGPIAAEIWTHSHYAKAVAKPQDG
jgi:hypothetical protein